MDEAYEVIREGDEIRITKLRTPFRGQWFDKISVDEAEELCVKLLESIREAA